MSVFQQRIARGDFMSKQQVSFQKDDEYYTPNSLVSRFGVFDYDPATNEDKAHDLNIAGYDTIDTDGLQTDWAKYRRIWCNPPFTIKHKFLRKAVETYIKDNSIDIFVLFPVEFLTTKRFHNAIGDGGGYNRWYDISSKRQN